MTYKKEPFPDALNHEEGEVVNLCPPIRAVSPVFTSETSYSYYVVDERNAVVRVDWVRAPGESMVAAAEYGGAKDRAESARGELIQEHRPHGLVDVQSMDSFVNLVAALGIPHPPATH